jgi:hypothetical protein
MAQNKERYLWPSSVVLHVPDSTSQILRVASQDADTSVLPSGANLHAMTPSLPFFEMSGNTYAVVVYASPPLRGREAKKKCAAKHATLRKIPKESPAALQLRQALALFFERA